MPTPEQPKAKPTMDPDMEARHPLRIPLAEGNVVNQKVAMRLLQQMGYRADLASNGWRRWSRCNASPTMGC